MRQSPTITTASPALAREQRQKESTALSPMNRIINICCTSALAAAVAIILVLWSRFTISVDPLERAGQVSLLAGVQLRAALLFLPSTLIAYWLSKHFTRLRGIEWAPVLSMSGAIPAASLAVALRGTREPLALSEGGDVRRYIEWAADDLSGGEGAPSVYPPGPIKLLLFVARFANLPLEQAEQIIQLSTIALLVPAVWALWQLLYSPGQAALLAIITTAPYLDMYKPLSSVALLSIPPLLLLGLRQVQQLHLHHLRGVIWRFLALGVAVGLITLLYSGWFIWFLPGALLFGLTLVPWREWRRVIVAFGCLSTGFLVTSGRYVFATLTADPIMDNYQYWDTSSDPAYFASWLGDLPGALSAAGGVWPPHGEFAGVSILTALLILALFLGNILPDRDRSVSAMSAIFGGAWLLRFYYASNMYQSGNVHLYPRSTQVLLLSTLIIAVLSGVRLFKLKSHPVSPLRKTAALLIAMFVLSASIGSAVGDAYLPADNGSTGIFAWDALHTGE